MEKSLHFSFDGDVGSYLPTAILAWLLTSVTLGIGYPWAVCMVQRWRTEHTYIDGEPLKFTGNGGDLFLLWIKWFLLCIITLGIYGFWVIPELNKWIVEHTDFATS